MATVEVEEDQLKLMAQARNLLGRLYGDPKLGTQFKQLLKAHNPNLSIPEIDAARPHVERLDKIEKTTSDAIGALSKKFDDYLDKQRERDEDADLHGKLGRVRSDFSLTDEGMEKLKKLMVDRNIADPEAAAALMTRQTPPAPAAPSGFRPDRWNLTRNTDDSSKHLLDDPEGWMEDEATRVWQEVAA
jgi:hypothetical protein